jgi:hypothetical protein
MSNVPQSEGPGKDDPGSRKSGPGYDLIAFLAILVLGGVLIALGHTTAASVATVCAALAALFAAWIRLHS